VRQLGGEAAFPTEARGQPVEERVQGGRELGQLVVRRAEREAVVELPFAPRGGLSGHPNNGPERGRQQPSRGKSYEQQYDCAEDERRDERRLSRLLVRRERDRGNDGADPPAAGDDRCSVEARVAPREVDEPRWLGGEAARCPIDRRPGVRALECASSREDPDVGVGRAAVGCLADREVAVIDTERCDPGCGARTHEIPCIPVERPGEHDVEARDKGGDDESYRCEHD